MHSTCPGAYSTRTRPTGSSIKLPHWHPVGGSHSHSEHLTALGGTGFPSPATQVEYWALGPYWNLIVR